MQLVPFTLNYVSCSIKGKGVDLKTKIVFKWYWNEKKLTWVLKSWWPFKLAGHFWSIHNEVIEFEKKELVGNCVGDANWNCEDWDWSRGCELNLRTSVLLSVTKKRVPGSKTIWWMINGLRLWAKILLASDWLKICLHNALLLLADRQSGKFELDHVT